MIDKLKWELIEATLEDQGREDKLEEIRKLRRKNVRPFFIWKLEFSDVFKENNGFDVIIGNPPYVGESKNKEIFRPIAKGNLGEFYIGKMDLFYFFFHLALNLGRKKAKCAFITTNYFLTAYGARKLRKDLKDRAVINNLINFNELRIFESAKGQHNIITIFEKDSNLEKKAKTMSTKRTGDANENILANIVCGTDKETAYCEMPQENLYDGLENYIRLRDKDNLNDPMQVILNKLQCESSRMGEYCNINQGVVSGCDTVSGRNKEKLTEKADIINGDGIFVFDLKNSRDIEILKSLNEEEKKLLRPFFKNSDINRYFCETIETKKLLYFGKGYDEIDKYPNIESHFERFREILEDRREVKNGRIKYHQLQWYRTEDIFKKEKIVVPYRTKVNTFAFNNQEWFCRSDCYVITKKQSGCDLRFILGLLNSTLYFQWLYHRGKRKGETLELFQVPLSEIPIKNFSSEEQQSFIKLVNQILEITTTPDYDPAKPPVRQKELEAKIDDMVFNLYGLTEEERKVVLES